MFFSNTKLEWFGKIPPEWKVSKIKYIHAQTKNSFTDGDWIESSEIVDTGIRYITTGNIGEGKFKYQGKGYINEQTFERLNCTEIFEGDLLISRLSPPVGRSCILPDLGNRAVTSVDNVVLRLNKDFSKEFYNFVFNSVLYFEHTETLSRGSTLTRISRNILGNIKVLVPPVEEQQLISKYLYKKTQKIDFLIEKIEKKIQLLKEQKDRTINQYVTKGLDPNVEMKDSGISIIGKIPKNWNLKKISHIVNFIGSGTTPKSNLNEYYENGEINWLITGDLIDQEIHETTKKITLKALEDNSLKIYPQNSLVIAMYGATIGKLGILKVKSTVNQACCVLNFEMHQDTNFWFNSFLGNRKYLVSLGYGGGQPNISQETIKGLRLPSPPDKSEQILISNILKKQSKKIDDLIKKHIKKKDLLREYRHSLISSVVTGKIRIKEDML